MRLRPERQNKLVKSDKIEYYKRWVSDHLQKAADLALRPKVMALYENANLLLKKVKLELSVKEEEFVR